MNPDGELKRVAMVKFERILPGPIERVWAMRGEPAEPRQAYMQRNAARYGVDLSNLVR